MISSQVDVDTCTSIVKDECSTSTHLAGGLTTHEKEEEEEEEEASATVAAARQGQSQETRVTR
jgi:hypothetical protein